MLLHASRCAAVLWQWPTAILRRGTGPFVRRLRRMRRLLLLWILLLLLLHGQLLLRRIAEVTW